MAKALKIEKEFFEEETIKKLQNLDENGSFVTLYLECIFNMTNDILSFKKFGEMLQFYKKGSGNIFLSVAKSLGLLTYNTSEQQIYIKNNKNVTITDCVC